MSLIHGRRWRHALLCFCKHCCACVCVCVCSERESGAALCLGSVLQQSDWQVLPDLAHNWTYSLCVLLLFNLISKQTKTNKQNPLILSADITVCSWECAGVLVCWCAGVRAVRGLYWAAAGGGWPFEWIDITVHIGSWQNNLVYRLKPSGHYMYRTVVTVCTAQWSLYVPPSGHCMYRTVVTICTTQWSLYVPHSGHYMYRTVVTICTTSLTFTTLRSAHTAVFMCFVWISEQTAIISLYNINWLLCITQTQSVYCAVRTDCAASEQPPDRLSQQNVS